VGVQLAYYISADITNNQFANLSPGIRNYLATLGDTSGNTFTNVATQIE
jgi:hypothetical protein